EFVHDEAAASACVSVLDGDRTWFVEGEAAKSLGRIRVARALPALEKVLATRESWNDVIRTHAVEGLAALRDPRGLPLVRAWRAPRRLSRAAPKRSLPFAQRVPWRVGTAFAQEIRVRKGSHGTQGLGELEASAYRLPDGTDAAG